MNLRTLPNQRPSVELFARHSLPLERMCPVSGNPQPGSRIAITYRPRVRVLEVYALTAYLRSYVGGHPSGVREMEAMVQQIAADCAAALQVPVTVRARVLLQLGQRLVYVAEARP